MGVVQVFLPDYIREAIDRQVAAGRAGNQPEFLVEAARRYAGEVELEVEIAIEAEAGIADTKAGRYVTINAPEDADTLHDRTMDRLRRNLTADAG